ncbi:MAG: cytochrome c oxidase subunit 3 [Verrucomicrobiota bacterium]
MDIPYTVTARGDTGLWNAKIGIWLFLASEVMLFGGLFSSYIFLRLGADYPWPMHELDVTLGFWNTIILILSSVFVVFAWAALKMRQYNKYRIWMFLVVFCALLFLVNKTFEYKAKFTHHYVVLNDGSTAAGHLHKGGDKIKFTADYLTYDFLNGRKMLRGGLANEGEVKFEGTNGKDLDFWLARFGKAHGLQQKADLLDANDEGEKADEVRAKLEADYPDFKDFEGGSTMRFKLNPPGQFELKRKVISSWKADELVFADETKLEGKLESAKIGITLDKIDLRQFLEPDRDGNVSREPKDSILFKHAPGMLDEFVESRDAGIALFEDKVARYAEKGKHVDGGQYRKYDSMVIPHDDSHGGEEAHHGPSDVEIPWEDVKFFSNYGPRKNTYYAIYFTLTGLHGLHVLGGALVLAYFLICGQSLYRKNPEHLANRVEVGGLFWHFVDLVWIFLFPILYLM